MYLIFIIVPWGVQRNKWGILTKTYKKHEAGNEKWASGNFLSKNIKNIEKYVIILLSQFIEKQFFNVMFEGVYISTYG